MRHYFWLLGCILFCTGIAVLAQEENNSVLPITEDTNYQVRPADTLDTIGALFDVSPTCIAETNDIARPSGILVGQTLLISVSCPRYGDDARDLAQGNVMIPREVVTFEDDCEGYRVQRNDSVDLIGFMLNVSTQSIIQANELLPPYLLDINQCLIIPEDAPPWGIYPALRNALGDVDPLPPGEQYVIQPNDTLDVIGQRFNVSVVSIIIVNRIRYPRLLQPGTAIIIPEDAPPYGLFPAIFGPLPGTLYVVREGETLDDIAQNFDVALVAIETANGIEAGHNAPVGTTLLIPDNVPTYGNDADFDESMLHQEYMGKTHVVQPRETMDMIAAFYNLNTACILAANQIVRPKYIQPGMVLIIDETCGPYIGEGRANLNQVTSPATQATDDEAMTEETPSDQAPAETDNSQTDEGDASTEG